MVPVTAPLRGPYKLVRRGLWYGGYAVVYKADPTGPSIFRGSYDECVAWVEAALAADGPETEASVAP